MKLYYSMQKTLSGTDKIDLAKAIYLLFESITHRKYEEKIGEQFGEGLTED